ncbi:MAG: hypothetical protein MHM6MM_006555 [Cercozoa sp. M6MM]
MDAIRSLLNKLMGPERDLTMAELAKVERLPWHSDRVCKNFLCGMCPYEALLQTKKDMGECGKLHDENLKREFDKENESVRMYYMKEWMRMLRRYHGDMEMEIRRKNHEREVSKDPREMLPPADRDTVAQLERRLDEQQRRIHDLVMKEDIDAAYALLPECRSVEDERNAILDTAIAALNSSGMADRFVCEVCGVFMSKNDAPSRLESHQTGRQHMAFVNFHANLKKVEKILADFDSRVRHGEAEPAIPKRRQQRERSRDRGRDRDRYRDSRRDDRYHRSDRDRRRSRRY